MIIIKDVAGNKLRLSRLRLTEIDHTSAYPFHLKLKDLFSAFNCGANATHIQGKDASGATWRAPGYRITFGCSIIGCHTFSATTYRKIIEAAKKAGK